MLETIKSDGSCRIGSNFGHSLQEMRLFTTAKGHPRSKDKHPQNNETAITEKYSLAEPCDSKKKKGSVLINTPPK